MDSSYDQEHFRWSNKRVKKNKPHDNENIQSIQIIQKKDVFAMYAFNKYTREKVEMKFHETTVNISQCTKNNFKLNGEVTSMKPRKM